MSLSDKMMKIHMLNTYKKKIMITQGLCRHGGPYPGWRQPGCMEDLGRCRHRDPTADVSGCVIRKYGSQHGKGETSTGSENRLDNDLNQPEYIVQQD